MPALSHAATATRGRALEHPRMPRIEACTPGIRAKLLEAYRIAYRWVRASAAWVRGALRSLNARRAWNDSVLRRLFGPFAPARARRVVRVVLGLLRRFVFGYGQRGQHAPTTLACLPATYERCRTGLLGNASIFGTLRFCPRLLTRAAPEVAQVVVHEMMHQGLGVGDRRHEDCAGSKQRCYRQGAHALVDAGRHDLALRNIDNYVAFIRHLGGHTD